MSLTSALNSALTGLTAASRAADVIAANIANLQTEGYGQRGLTLSAAREGGVQVTGILRQSDPAVIADRRLAQSAAAAEDAVLSFFRTMEAETGLPGTAGSLSDRVTALADALDTASLSPGSAPALSAVLRAGQDLAAGLNHLSDRVQQARMVAEQTIALDVAQLNAALTRVAELNDMIPGLKARGQDVSALMDQRQQEIDRISSLVSLREYQATDDRVRLYTTGGLTLVEDRATNFHFSLSGAIAPGSGALSALFANDRVVSTKPNGPLGAGSLSAAFDIRDDLAPQVQSRFDQFAQDLILRFEAADSRATADGVAAFFTDQGARSDPSQQMGLAGRISVNALADPDQGGALWRISSGMSALIPVQSADSQMLVAMASSILVSRAGPSPDFPAGSYTLPGLAGAVFSFLSTERLAAEARAGFVAGQKAAFQLKEAEGSVDHDQEMQKLLLVEQHYGASARLLQTVDEMIKRLLEI